MPAVDDVLEQMLKLAGSVRMQLSPAWSPSVDVFEVDESFVVIVDLAGVHRDDITLSVTDGRLHISGTRRPPPVACPHAVQQLEIDYGPFERTVRLGPGIDEERIVAEYRNGLLLVSVPRRAGQRVAIRVEE